MDSGADGGRPIVVGVDETDSARSAAEWAAELAAVTGAPLRLVHSAPATGEIGAVPGRLRDLIDSARAKGARTGDLEVVAGGTVSTLADDAVGARMLVLGSYGSGAWGGMLAGDVALALAGDVPCPVAVVRGPEPQTAPQRSGPVVAGVDGSATARVALALAADLAEELGSRLVVVHAWSELVTTESGAHRRTEEWPVIQARAGAILDAEIRTVSSPHPELAIERRLVHDTPVRALLELAVPTRLLVVGHRGHRAALGTIGSTSRTLVEFAPCPVIVTPPAGGATRVEAIEDTAGGVM